MQAGEVGQTAPADLLFSCRVPCGHVASLASSDGLGYPKFVDRKHLAVRKALFIRTSLHNPQIQSGTVVRYQRCS